jgi:carbon storage regulator CsrA
MLVLSRRVNEKIVFPGIDVTVQVVAVKPGVVRLGIEAPPHVAVLREEVLARDGNGAALPKPSAPTADQELRHQLRNRLNAATIGLALMRRQLQMSQGQNVVATLDKVEQELDHLRRLAEAAGPARPRPTRRYKALLVEDDRNECELLAGFLRLAGLDVDTANDGADALDYLRAQGRPDVVLLGMLMPRCDGAATVRAIRRDPAHAGIKVFAVSGHERERFNLDAPIDRWFTKPIDPQALLRELSAALGNA